MKKVIQTSGKRKRAVARATLHEGTGKITINGQALESFSNSVFRLRVAEPVTLAADKRGHIDIDIHAHGGGTYGQADAIRLAIARALVESDKKLKKVFDDYDQLLLVADVRRKEMRKPNDSKARKKRQKSYR